MVHCKVSHHCGVGGEAPSQGDVLNPDTFSGSRMLKNTARPPAGAVAQLVERPLCMREVGGSKPSGSSVIAAAVWCLLRPPPLLSSTFCALLRLPPTQPAECAPCSGGIN